METAWAVTGIGVPALVTVGLAVLSVPNSTMAEFWVARACFFVAALWLAVVGAYWLTTTEQAIWVRIVSGLVIGTLVFVGLPLSLRWVSSKEERVAPTAPSDTLLRPQAGTAAELRMNTSIHALLIEFGEGGRFEEVLDLTDGKRGRMVKVAVRNVGSGRLNECALRITRITPVPAGFKPPLKLNGRFAIERGKCEYVGVADYVESDPSGFDKWPIRLCQAPVSGAFLSGPWGSLSVSEDRQEYEITLEASAHDSKDARAHARLWVDERNRLRLEQIT